MSYSHESLHITPSEYNDELIPALHVWTQELDKYGVDPMSWFLFGSVVKRTVETVPTQEDLILAILGGRGPSRAFRPDSDIDVGVIVPDMDDLIDLPTNNPDSPFRNARVAGRLLSMTRFSEQWVKRRNLEVSDLQHGTPTLGIYGQIVPVEL